MTTRLPIDTRCAFPTCHRWTRGSRYCPQHFAERVPRQAARSARLTVYVLNTPRHAALLALVAAAVGWVVWG